MSGDREPAIVRCIIVDDSRDSSLRILQKGPRGNEIDVWIPRSQLDHISKRGKNTAGEMEAEIEMPEWLAEDRGLDYK